MPKFVNKAADRVIRDPCDPSSKNGTEIVFENGH
jgi:hypothetical protein